jgi:hypothetical protein
MDLTWSAKSREDEAFYDSLKIWPDNMAGWPYAATD